MPFQNPALAHGEFVKTGFTVNVLIGGTNPATAARYERFWTAPAKCVVDSVDATWSVASSSGTLNVEKVASGTAQDSGTDMLSSTISTAGAADTVTAGTLSTTLATVELAVGDSLALVNSGTLTNLTDLHVTVGLHYIP